MQIHPREKDFIELARNHNLIVLSSKFYSDWLTPLSIYYALSRGMKGESFLLESVEGEEKISRYSFLGFLPLITFKSKGRTIYLKDKEKRIFTTEKDPLYELRKVMSTFRVAPYENIRFFGGFVGYLGYDLVRFFEPLGKELPPSLDTFDSYLILPKFLIIFDHLKKQIEFLSLVRLTPTETLRTLYQGEKKIMQQVLQKMATPHKLSFLSLDTPRPMYMRSNFTKRQFFKAVRRAKEYIRNGDIIQTVLSQRFSFDFYGDPLLAYRYLRLLNPSPYMFYLNFEDVRLAGSSPEMLLRCEKNELITRPIAGTRKRGKDEGEDRALEASLLHDPKELAEHIMLVDLARNDLGRVGSDGSVTTPLFMSVERFSHVMHIVSEVRARLKNRQDIFSALQSCFPAGTVSGAPKVRAMQIINELEATRRGIYAGCVGYFSFTQSLDTCIIIRTIVFKNKKAYIQAGAGIVYDSKPQREYKETLNKAKAQVLALQLAAQGGCDG